MHAIQLNVRHEIIRGLWSTQFGDYKVIPKTTGQVTPFIPQFLGALVQYTVEHFQALCFSWTVQSSTDILIYNKLIILMQWFILKGWKLKHILLNNQKPKRLLKESFKSSLCSLFYYLPLSVQHKCTKYLPRSTINNSPLLLRLMLGSYISWTM